ncbi:dTDP-4-dehydrorhamnose reductase [Jannaschia rubra]|uniref:dTDP-4-dehydrorhamnose reductase n=1 Tax=Jannaschia rubra TaxID=282197 RepID=UPI00248F92EC|nr:dTDP-4-dehydrorhamnose reductase [Jannaschia rubra]
MILVFGRTGQVARELAAASDDVRCLGRTEADLSVPGACDAAIRVIRPAAVINAAAWTDVDAAEAEEEAATRINGAAPGEMARACTDLGIPLVHISTDYVFDGSGDAPWSPDDATAPLGAYGRSKLAGEKAVVAAGCAHVILRTSWVFSGHGRNFLLTMLRLGAERERLTVVADQIGGPTPADAIAAACLKVQDALRDGAPSGIHHFAGTPDVSWADFARGIFEAAGMSCTVEGIPASAWPTPAARPANSRMDCSALRVAFGIERPDWREGTGRILAARL